MTGRMENAKELPTIWRVPDELWNKIAPIPARYGPPKRTGRRRMDPRLAPDGIIYRMRSGCQWNHLPKEFGDDSTIHRTFRRWERQGIFVLMWATLVEGCEELGGVDWEWQAAEAAMGKARLGDLVGPNPIDRAKKGVKRSPLVEGDGGPLAVVVAGANVHHTQLLAATLHAGVVERPQPSEEAPQHLCLGKGYDNPTGRQAALERGYTPHIRLIGEERRTKDGLRYPSRRWVVERILAWLSKCRAILVRYDKEARNYLALIKLACALLWYRRQHRLCVLR